MRAKQGWSCDPRLGDWGLWLRARVQWDGRGWWQSWVRGAEPRALGDHVGPPGPGPLLFVLLGQGAEWPELALLLALPAALSLLPLRARGLSCLSSGLSGPGHSLGPCWALGWLREDRGRAEVTLGRQGSAGSRGLRSWSPLLVPESLRPLAMPPVEGGACSPLRAALCGRLGPGKQGHWFLHAWGPGCILCPSHLGHEGLPGAGWPLG